MNDWAVVERGFDPDRITANGNKWMTGNGRIGIRGTLDEFGREELTACIVAGLYDKVGSAWREPVNAPNGLRTRITAEGEQLHVRSAKVEEHEMRLDIRKGILGRKTLFRTASGGTVELRSERFVSRELKQSVLLRLTVTASYDVVLKVETGIDGDVWDLNGPHLERMEALERDGALLLSAVTHELGVEVAVAERLLSVEGAEDVQERTVRSGAAIMRELTLRCRAGEPVVMEKAVSVRHGRDGSDDPAAEALREAALAADRGYDSLLTRHEELWEELWERSDVEIEGDDEARFALRYSLYQLLIIAPLDSGAVSIPARGLSGQVYKGAVFWDTEMFMLPFFLHTNPAVARNLMEYRIHTLDGARRKAAEYGFRGAFYAWESQDTGDDACTLFNVTDVFTNRPMRTYFRDKQIHISADVAYGFWQYVRLTGDQTLLLDGGAEAVLECARFFLSYAYYKEDRDRYELLDVTGPDEYHERVHNNAFTNKMAQRTLRIALDLVELLTAAHPDFVRELLDRLDYSRDLEALRRMNAKLYVPEPDPHTGIIEQFDGYLRLEDVPLPVLKQRVLIPNEYWGGGSGLATTTQVLKQADTVLMLHLFRDEYSPEVKRANWEYYEPRTEHGSSLSACIYAMVAADIGMPDWGLRYFRRTATIDLTGDSKQYVGTLYIGGTHPAANGGAWMAAVQGFAGLRTDGEVLRLEPKLPSEWTGIRFSVDLLGRHIRIALRRDSVRFEASADNTGRQTVEWMGRRAELDPGETLELSLTGAAGF